MKTTPKYNRSIKTVLLFVLLFAATLANASMCSPFTDSTKNKFPLSDPRNPDCPCHKYQAQADREYAQLLGKLPDENQGQRVINGKDQSATKKVTHVRKRFSLFASHKESKPKNRKTERFRDRLAGCFHW